MGTECTATKLRFHGLAGRRVEGLFDGGEITSDAGGLVLREVERRTGMLGRLGACFADHRRADRVEHPVERLVKQRVPGICLGCEDLNDHDEPSRDRLPALLCDCADVGGAGRRRASDRGRPLAGKSTPNRPEPAPAASPMSRTRSAWKVRSNPLIGIMPPRLAGTRRLRRPKPASMRSVKPGRSGFRESLTARPTCVTPTPGTTQPMVAGCPFTVDETVQAITVVVRWFVLVLYPFE